MESSFEKMYSVKEVAALLGWSPDTIRRLIYRGTFGQSRCLRRVVVNEFIARRESGRGTYDGSSILGIPSSDGAAARPPLIVGSSSVP